MTSGRVPEPIWFAAILLGIIAGASTSEGEGILGASLRMFGFAIAFVFIVAIGFAALATFKAPRNRG